MADAPDERAALARRAARGVAKEDRGQLKVFLGVAPGVGKTYAMLDRRSGARTTASTSWSAWWRPTAGAIPRRCSRASRSCPAGPSSTGQALQEFDLDAALARRPELLLVDELAHTNAPGSRHAKRYLDVEELVQAGIDVYTTLNIQHLESLNDIVAQITRIRVRETLPDSVLDAADEIELVDVTPEELIERLQGGQGLYPASRRSARSATTSSPAT